MGVWEVEGMGVVERPIMITEKIQHVRPWRTNLLLVTVLLGVSACSAGWGAVSGFPGEAAAGTMEKHGAGACCEEGIVIG